MKKILYIFSFLSLVSCSKEWLELDQPGNIDKPYFIDGSKAYEAVIAAYDVQIWRNNIVGLWAVGTVLSDDAVKGGESDGDQQGMFDMMNFNATPQTDIPHWIWDDMYRLIARSNFAIDIMVEENVDGTKVLDMDEGNRLRYIAECRFLRAYAYFRLVRNFGGVMIYTSAEDDGTNHGEDISAGKPRATADEVYSQIIADLTYAEANLPTTVALAEQGRATSGAAKGLLAKTYLYQENWTAAKNKCEEIMGSGNYSLVSDYSNIFSSSQQWGSEVIWSLHMVEDLDGHWGEHEGSWLSIWFGDRDMGWGYGFKCPTEDFVQAFEPNDDRLEASVVFDGEMIPGTFGGAPHNFTGGSWNPPTGYMSQKYLIPDNERPITADCNGNLDYIFMRYAEVLLMHAEASMEIGDEAAARSSLALIRQRAGLSDYPDATTINSYKEKSLLGHNDLKAVVYHERRVELGLEHDRFYDLVRWGDASIVFQNFDHFGQTFGKTNFVTGCSELLPIPYYDIQSSNDLITQNPCY